MMELSVVFEAIASAVISGLIVSLFVLALIVSLEEKESAGKKAFIPEPSLLVWHGWFRHRQCAMRTRSTIAIRLFRKPARRFDTICTSAKDALQAKSRKSSE